MDPTAVEVVGEALVWTQRWWTRPGRHRCGLGGVEERVAKFGSLLVSCPNPTVRVYGEGGWGFYRWTTVATNMIMSSCLLLLGSTVATGMLTSSCSSLLCFSYFNELVKSLKMYLNGFKNINPFSNG
jgi:hypothetical protein